MVIKQLYIVRHGETDFNRQNIVQGSGVDKEINELGQQQAQLFYEHYQHIPFQHVFTSALVRTHQSVASFLQKGIKHTALAELNEISWGDFEGKFQTAEQKDLYWETVTQWRNGILDAKITNGESPIEMQARQQVALQHILNTNAENVLVCMHGRALKSFLCLMLNEPLTNMELFKHTNLCLYQLTYDGTKFSLVKANDTAHLEKQM
ncbi:MAG: histidine phosphatase family protein [Bacteroidia bacterium]|nr:histidine phosphatase family protein [Bacteroidia bacterium]